MRILNEGLDGAALALKTLAWLSLHCPTLEVWQKHVQNFTSSLGIRMGNFIHLFVWVDEAEWEIVYPPCSQKKKKRKGRNLVGVWKLRLLTCKSPRPAIAHCGAINERCIFLTGLLDNSGPIIKHSCVFYSSSFIFWGWNQELKLQDKGASFLPHIFPLDSIWPLCFATPDPSSDIKRLCRSQVTKTMTSYRDMNNDPRAVMSYISFPPRLLSGPSGRKCLYASVRVQQVLSGWWVFGVSLQCFLL